jgi:hypothetical protein
MEHVDSFHLLTGSNKLDWLRDHGADREGRTTTGITIELREHHAIEIEAVIELLGCINSILTGHGVDNEQRLIRDHSMFLEIEEISFIICSSTARRPAVSMMTTSLPLALASAIA